MDRIRMICLQYYNEQMPPFQLIKCKHIFHEKCIKDWKQVSMFLGAKTFCPECKLEFKNTDIQMDCGVLTMNLNKNLHVQCKIHLPNDQTIDITINNSWNVSELCKIIEVYSKIPSENQTFNYNRKCFSYEQDANKKILNFGLENGSIILMTQKTKLFQIFLKNMDGSNQNKLGITTVLSVSSDMTMDTFYDLVEQTTKIPKEKSRFHAGVKAFSIKSHNQNYTVGDLHIDQNMYVYQNVWMHS